MPEQYVVRIDSETEIHSLPDSWSPQALRQLLELGELDDVDQLVDDELVDMAAMVLQDMGNQVGGELVLESLFGESMRPGVRQNLVDDLADNEPWNDVAEMAQQRGVFEAIILLHEAFPNRYGTPDAARLQVTVTANRDSGIEAMNNLNPQWLVRVLAAGLTERDTLMRLYGAELATASFTDAAHILWHHKQVSQEGRACTYELIASKQWFASLAQGDEFTASI